MAKIFTPVKCKGISRRVITSAWGLHPTFTALAVAIEGGAVGFYQDEGDLIESRTVMRANAEVTNLAWCPTKPLLVIAWNDGTISIWNESTGTGQTTDDSEVHSGRIVTVLRWSPDGTRLVSGDEGGRVSVWKVDPMGRLSTVCTHTRAGPITHCVYKPAAKSKSAAASLSSGFSVAEQPPFYFANEAGNVCIADDMGHCNDVVALGMPLSALLYYGAKDHLVALTKGLVLAQFRSEPGGKMSQVQKVKLSVAGGAEAGISGCGWLCEGHLATVSSEAIVRVWDLANEDNYVLHLQDDAGLLAGHRAVSVSYHAARRLLAVGTTGGSIAVWALRVPKGAKGQQVDDSCWKMLRPMAALDGPVRAVAWGAAHSLIAGTGADGVAVCAESALARLVREDWALIQVDAYSFVLEHTTSGHQAELRTGMRTRGADMSGNRILLWNGTRAEVHELTGAIPGGQDAKGVELISHFAAPTLTMAMHKDSVYMVSEGRLNVANLKGVVRSTLPFMDAEGPPVLIAVTKSVLCACTAKGVLRVWDISRNEPKPMSVGRTFDVPGAGPVVSVQPNGFGTAVSILTQAPAEPAPPQAGYRGRQPQAPAGGSALSVAAASGERAAVVHVYQIESDAFLAYDFGNQGAVPLEHAWDATDPRLLGVLTESPGAEEGDAGENGAAPAGIRARKGGGLDVTTLFATADHGLRMQDTFPVAKHVESLLALQCPRILFAGLPPALAPPDDDDEDADADAGGHFAGSPGARGGRTAGSADDIPFDRVHGDCRVTARLMRDFAGVDLARGASVDAAMREALLSFSYHLTIGNMDDAYRAVRAIKSGSVWENMARMCVKTRRVDVAEVCLGNMGDARGAAAVREARAEPEPEACIAMLAIQLGMTEDAARLYAQCGRLDLLNKMYQAAGQWDRALALARDKDRIHLSSTYYEYAKHLEGQGRVEAAAEAFEKAGTHRTDVPRMYYTAGRLEDLREYVDRAGDPELLRWWAKYAESTGDPHTAMAYYERAEDTLARVRVLCLQGRLDEAADLANASSDLSASFRLARQYEARGMPREAIHFFTRAQRYNHAARLAREHGLTSELQSLSLQAPTQMQEEAAVFFEQRGQLDKAVQLYTKAGHTQRALDLCFRHSLFDQLRDIADSLGEDADPRVLAQCADFFLDHGQYDKTVSLYVMAGEHGKALDLCVLHAIPITEEMAERMCPTVKLDNPAAEERRVETLLKIAKCCKRQGAYRLATKKYTQAGDKVKAMKCLLKSGETDKIIYFADVSRSKEIWILGANYLQNLDWHSEPKVLKKIVEFYRKAKAPEQLASFYEACAAVEVDEYRDYDKALDALREALKAVEGARVVGRDERVAALQQRVSYVERFVAARRIVKTDPQAMVDTCNLLLNEPGINETIRVGDIFALMVEWFNSQRDYAQAHQLIERMRAQRIELAPFLDADLIETVYSSVGAQPAVGTPMVGAHEEQRLEGEVADEIIDDEVVEDDDDD